MKRRIEAKKDARHSEERSRAWMVGTALVLATAAVYSRACFNDFVDFDDSFYATENDRVQRGLTSENIRWALTSLEHANWHPLTWLSLQLDATLYGRWAAGFHATNVVIHVINTVLLFWILQRSTAALAKSGLTAALFALHPLHVESVAWVSERKDVLSALCWLLTMAAYSEYVGGRSLRWYVAGVVLFALGLAAKPMLVTLPFVLLLWDFWPLHRLDAGSDSATRYPLRLVVEKLPLILLAAVSCVITYEAQHRTGAIRASDVLSFSDRLAHVPLAYLEYLAKTVWPVNLTAYYPYSDLRRSMTLAVAATVFVAIVTILVIRRRRRQPYLPVGWFWFLGTLVPTIGLVQVGGQAIADRYTYLPLIGVFIAGVWGIDELAQRRYIPRPLLTAGTAVVLMLLALVSWRQIGYWHDSVTLWRHAVDVNGVTNPQLSGSLGKALVTAGRDTEALTHLQAAAAANASDSSVYSSLGVALYHLHRYSESESELEHAIGINPRDDIAPYNLAFVKLALGKTAEAIRAFEDSLSINPSRWSAELALAEILAKHGAGAEAQVHFERAVGIGRQAALDTWRRSHPGAADAAELAEQVTRRPRSEE